MSTIPASVKSAVDARGRATAPPVITFKEDQLDKKLVNAAVQACEAAIGIQQEINAKVAKVNVLVYGIIRDAVRVTMVGKTANLPQAEAYAICLFAAAEKQAVAKWNEKHGNEETIRDISPTWASHKSTMLKGLREGLNPFERTENDAPKYEEGKPAQYAAAVRELTANRAPQTPDTKVPDAKVISLSAVKLGMSPELSTAFGNLAMALHRLNLTEQVSAIGLVIAVTAQVKALHVETAPAASVPATAPKGEKA